MRVIVAGDIRVDAILLNTDKATAVFIETDDGEPAIIISMLPGGNGYMRLTRGEDPEFESLARQLKIKP